MVIKNLTPHQIIIRDENGNALVTIERAGGFARVEEHDSPTEPIVIDGVSVPMIEKTFTGRVAGLPEQPQAGVLYIVPLLTAVAAKAAGRSTEDLLVPGEQTRDSAGTVNGCLLLARLI